MQPTHEPATPAIDMGRSNLETPTSWISGVVSTSFSLSSLLLYLFPHSLKNAWAHAAAHAHRSLNAIAIVRPYDVDFISIFSAVDTQRGGRGEIDRWRLGMTQQFNGRMWVRNYFDP